MLLTITTTYHPATDLGYLLHKHPEAAHTFEWPWGKIHIFYPEATEARCTAALLLDIDPVSLVRERGASSDLLTHYVNDRPYAASSFLSVALAHVFRTALSGRCDDRPELAQTALPLEVTLSALPCRGGERMLREMFEPLGYEVSATTRLLDETFPEWGGSDYFQVTLRGTVRLCDLLSHLYVLIPVLDDRKHYRVAEPEIEKLLTRGASWLAGHPQRDLISRRYLRYRRRLVNAALARLSDEDKPDAETIEEEQSMKEAALEARLSLNDYRMETVAAALKERNAKRVLDLGCGEGNLLRVLLADRTFTEIVGLDVSSRALTMAGRRLRLDRLAPRQQARVRLLQGALTYRDQRLVGYDAAAVIEVIEHFDLPRLTAFERVLFEFTRPTTIVITTPNVEYNVKFDTLPAGRLRHRDHRFEWTREEFTAWAQRAADTHGYQVGFHPIGEVDAVVGAPTQMAVFARREGGT